MTDPTSAIDTLLAPFHQFGVNLGLSRIQTLLAALGSPHHSVPIIHVAGTNGKGSVCAYLSSILTAAGYRVGRYTSPHLVDWNERICIDDRPIDTKIALEILDRVIQAIDPNLPTPTQFEIVTAAMWLYFADSQVDIAVIEVGLGGRLDATNVCDEPLATVITSISIDHWQQLGDTIAKIAAEKAGILKPNCWAIIGTLPPDAVAVVTDRIAQLDCPVKWVKPAVKVPTVRFSSETPSAAKSLPWYEFAGIEYPLTLLGEMQLTNSAIAIATIDVLRRLGWGISDEAIIAGMTNTRWLGRMQWTTWQGDKLLIDGAHNPAAAVALRQYIDTLNTPISWAIGMLSTKAHREIFQALLRPGDRLYLVPIPDHSSADLNLLADLARSVCPEIGSIDIYPDLVAGLTAAISSSNTHQPVLCGSLYLLGYFLKLNRSTL
ncbi:bifunctional folylpolyglutamate synthase/dihydrofolate synthase [Chamaesiphon polymorphus]|uniref:tetrahydrofolate synthase n=1 Tax=Chamaesiphon polymorphus CCALA 037 TaxID=2107692 RepID=A0A2T1GER0_9CYAN|nr:folylpolyglutamate synthase/dihydrofolate synthase family protein [Chamaesiphon polymorphus]PSB56032.1 bifunctional folylpolyglutamate synthase/dihydrofolate synthase [Chamaesiphon polymorphus CCALA 037]